MIFNFLTCLELHGFKSFAPKTRFELPSRVIGVVGPNGSGKSNIIDAIRWVLGEREARYLRGDVLGNLMFAGTPKKPAASVARVSLTFDNRKRTLPIDSEEVTLSRRIDRSGTTQFFLNDAEIKLKELAPLLAKARLGSRGLTIIGQGQSDMFVHIAPTERREMIEEIIGLKEFRLKKKTAERRLIKSRINISTLKAQVDELAPHLRFLRRQRNKWEKRAEVETKLKELAARYFSSRHQTFLTQLQEINACLAENEQAREKKSRTVNQLEQAINASQNKGGYKEKLGVLREKVEAFHEKRLCVQRELTRLEARIELQASAAEQESADASPNGVQLMRLIRSFLNEIIPARKSGDVSGIKRVLDKWIRSFEGVFSSVDESRDEEKDIQRLQDELENIGTQITELHCEEDEILTNQENQNDAFRERVKRLEKGKNGEFERIFDAVMYSCINSR